MERDWQDLPPYRAVLAVDTRNFSALDSEAQREVNSGIREVLRSALDVIGLSTEWRKHDFGQHTGDGYVGGLVPTCLPGLIGSFPAALSEALRQWKPRGNVADPVQLRVSVHVGPLDETGIGDPMVHTHRLLDENSLRRVLDRADPQITNVAVVISDRVYEDVFRSGVRTGQTVAGHYREQIAKVKAFERPAWIHVPGLDWRLVDPELFEPPVPAEPAEQPSPKSAEKPSMTFSQQGDGTLFQGYKVTAHVTGGRDD
ncbi:hypothetical protein ACIA49_04070 [Kribbella sp. NPDC051587]|uniref:hypothetical protein n=1 Tax=Kribbella sp. NPDC051587 TaxID=3364119 RepID=UPI003797B692